MNDNGQPILTILRQITGKLHFTETCKEPCDFVELNFTWRIKRIFCATFIPALAFAFVVLKKYMHNTEPFFTYMHHSKDLIFHAGMNTLLDTFLFVFSRLSSQGNLLHGTHRYSDALRHEEAYRSGSQIRKARRQRRNLHRQTRTVRKAVHGVYYQSTRVVVN